MTSGDFEALLDPNRMPTTMAHTTGKTIAQAYTAVGEGAVTPLPIVDGRKNLPQKTDDEAM